jgi:hypothetical protein
MAGVGGQKAEGGKKQSTMQEIKHTVFGGKTEGYWQKN